jgi:hypothetical protein
MALWSNSDANTSAPKFAVASGSGVSGSGDTLFGNTTAGVFVTGQAVGTFGVDATEQGITKTAAHAGWVLRKAGMGPVLTITANTGAVGANSYVIFTGGGTANTVANARVSVNSAGFIQSVTVLSGGQYVSTPTATPNTGNAVFTVTMGGRANRVQSETLVAMGSMTGDGSDDTIYPDS